MAAVDEKRDQHVDNATEKEVEDKKMFVDEEDPSLDYTGAAKKTDPEEIKLVRKLDYRIMVRSALSHHPR